MTIHLLTGDDDRLLSDKVSEITTALIRSMNSHENRSTILETHDLSGANPELRETIIRQAITSCETMSLFGEERIIVIKGLCDATVAELAGLVTYIFNPVESTHLVATAMGKLPRSVSDAFNRCGATVISTIPPSRHQELVTWFIEKFTEADLKIEHTAVQEIINWLGEDQARVIGIIDLLVSTYGTSKKISRDDVMQFLGEAGSVKPWDLTDAIDEGNVVTSLEMLTRMTRSGEFHSLQVLAVLNTHYTKLLKLDGLDLHSPADALAAIGGKSEFQGRKYLTQFHRLGPGSIAQAIHLLAQVDIDLRGGKDLPEELTMEVLVARLCRLGTSSTLKRR